MAGTDQEIRISTLTRDVPEQGEERNDVHGDTDGSYPSDKPLTGDIEARDDFWSISGNHICRHHVQPRVKLYVPKEGSSPIPLKIVVVRRTNTTLDVLLEYVEHLSI